MADELTEPLANPPAEGQQAGPVPDGMSRRDYWKMVSEQAHPQEDLPPAPTAPAAEWAGQDPPPPRRLPRKLRWPHPKFGPPFWTITGFLSLFVNVILLVVLYLLAQQIFSLKNVLNAQLIAGLNNNFALMDQAHIKTTIPINTFVPAKFDVPLNTNTIVKLQSDVLIHKAHVLNLKTGTLTILDAAADILLPAGTELPVSLSLMVPVDEQIPVNLTVDVDIPLNQTDLHTPFVGLQNVVEPYYQLLNQTPNTLQDAVCGKYGSDLCKSIIH